MGTVTATGTYNGQQVIFIGDKYYPLSSIMAVGTLPETAVDGSDTSVKPTEPCDGEDVDETEDVENNGDNGADVDDPEKTGEEADEASEAAFRAAFGIPEGLAIED